MKGFSSTVIAPLCRAALSLGSRLAEIGSGHDTSGHDTSGQTAPLSSPLTPPKQDMSYAERLHQELERFKTVENVGDLPEIFSFWSQRYVRPKLEEVCGVSTFEDFFAKYIIQYSVEHPDELVEIYSIGAGNADIEVRIAQNLLARKFENFEFHCLDINPSMLGRGRELAVQSQLGDRFKFHEIDVAHWHAVHPIPVVIAHHSLHHIVALEDLFKNIKEAIGNSGYFLTCDMIGRNGHMRWPEALSIVQDIWRAMPDRYKYNHQLRRFETQYENWDCSHEGFEGIRSQDILPLLLSDFHFESFVAYGNLIDIFIDRGFGHNFELANPEDTAFIDRIGALNDRLIDAGVIKPTQMIAALRGSPVPSSRWHGNWSPAFCVRHKLSLLAPYATGQTI